METNNKKKYIVDFLGNRTYVGNTICVMVRLDIGIDKETLVFTVIEHIQGKFAHITVNGIKRFLEKGTFWIVKPSEIKKLYLQPDPNLVERFESDLDTITNLIGWEESYKIDKRKKEFIEKYKPYLQSHNHEPK